jgi:Ca2+-binding EF-hand superfamily protein
MTMNSRTRTAAFAAFILALAGGGSATAADEPKPAPKRPQLNPIDLNRLWQATGPAIRAGRMPELFEQTQSNFSTAPRTAGQAGGWYHASQSRYTWEWFASRFDVNADGAILRAEFAGPVAAWERLDRDHDGVIAAADFDWSERSAWYQMARQGSRRFDMIDSDGNGRITAEEWQAFFAVVADEKDHLTNDDLRDAMFIDAERPRARFAKFADRVDRLKVILNGDIGSMFEGPELGAPAPDFTLATHDRRGVVKFADYRGNKPVVLIFGSFT